MVYSNIFEMDRVFDLVNNSCSCEISLLPLFCHLIELSYGLSVNLLMDRRFSFLLCLSFLFNSRKEILNYSFICLLLLSFTILFASQVLLIYFPLL